MKFLLSFFVLGSMAIDTTMLMMMMQQQTAQNPVQGNQMNMMLPLLLLKDSDNKTSENSDMLMLMMMQGQGMGNMQSVLPLLLLNDKSMDFKSLFLLTNMMNQDCARDTDQQMNSLMPLLLMDKGASNTTNTDSLMMLMMMQTMGNNPVGINQMMPFIMMGNKTESDSLLMMVMLSSMSGGMSNQQGFDNSFNMLLPLLMKDDCAKTDTACQKKQTNMLVLMMAMQSQGPNTQMGPNTILPLLLMKDDKNNENLMFYMMMSQNRQAC